MTGLDEFAASTTWTPAPARYGRTWEIRLPWTKPPLSLNDRSHWRAKAQATAQVRGLTREAVVAACWGDKVHLKLPPRVAVLLTYVPRDKRRRDADNLVGTLKACCDGIVSAGLVADDTPDLMLKHMPVIAEPDGDPRLVLVIREVLGA